MVAYPTNTAQISPQQLRRELRLSRERMARLMDVSAKTIERWEARADIPPAASARQRLMSIREILDLGRLVYTPDGFQAFLTTPQPRFQGATALQLMEIGRIADILAALAEDYEGLGT
jgi:transcriptional regulator with XRE-family HTH domain